MVSLRRGRAGVAAATHHRPRPQGAIVDVLVSVRRPGVAFAGDRSARVGRKALVVSALAPTLQAFFTERLGRQRQASPQTVAAYRDAFRLLVGFAGRQTGNAPSILDFEDLDAKVIGAFLDHLEKERGNTARTRNARLGAIRSLFRFAALRHPEHAELIQQVLAIPQKRFVKKAVSFLTAKELEALVAAPDTTTWEGRRDRTLIVLGAQTGLRVSELLGLNRDDVALGVGAHVRCVGKGRKERAVPLTGPTQAVLREWLRNAVAWRTTRCSPPAPDDA